MAFVKKQQEEQADTMGVLAPQGQQQQQPDQQQQQQGPVSVSGSPGMVGAGTTQSPSAKPSSSGAFTNIRNFFDANKGAGQQIANTVGNATAQKAQSIGQVVQQKQQEYTDLAKQAQQNVAQAQNTGTGLVSNIMAGSNTAPTPDQIAQYQASIKGQGIAGNDLSDIGDFRANTAQQQQDTAKLAGQAQQARTAQGSFGLLRDYLAKPQQRYTTGAQALDTAFLRNSPEAQNNLISGIKKSTGDLNAQQKSAQQTASEAAQQTYNQKQQMQKALEDARTGATTGLQKGINDRASAEQTTRDSALQQVNAAIAKGNMYDLSPEMQKAFGLDQAKMDQMYQQQINPILSGQDIYTSQADLDAAKQYFGLASLKSGNLQGLGNYLNAPTMTTPEYQSRLASTDELTKAKALAGLVGGQQNIIADESLVGKGMGPGYHGIDFNTAGAVNAAAPFAQAVIDQSKSGIGQGNMQMTANRYAQSLIEQGMDPTQAQNTANNMTNFNQIAVATGNNNPQMSGVQGMNSVRDAVVWGEQEAYRRQAVENMMRKLQGQGTLNDTDKAAYAQEYGNYGNTQLSPQSQAAIDAAWQARRQQMEPV
jgi:hypothetical protein